MSIALHHLFLNHTRYDFVMQHIFALLLQLN
jgi:hypothetical protein